jgi:hypothetical protein
MQVFKDGRVAHYKDLFPNTSFPAGGPTDSFLASHGAYKVSVFRDHNRATQKLVSCSPVVENGFAYTVEVVDKTEEEIAADVASKAAKVRAERDRKLAETDWTQVADSPVDSTVWSVYRQSLRDIPSQEGFPQEVTWPDQPE